MADETLRVSLSCIGLCVPSAPIGLCVIMMQQTNPCGIYCIPLTKENSDIVSPLYEHDLTLVACDAMGLEDPHNVLCNFTGETCFRVEERRGFRYRLDKQYKHKEMAKKLREFISHTLFIASEFHHQPVDGESALFKPFFQNNKAMYGVEKFAYFNCANDDERTTLNGYLLLLTVLEEQKTKQRGGRKSLYTLYWEGCANENVSLLDTAMANLIQFAPHDKLYQQRDILALFQGWKAYKRIGLYFTHQALGMDVSYTLYRLFAKHTTLVNPALLPLNARIDMYNFFILICKILKEEEAQKPLTPFTTKDVPYSLLTEHIKGGLYDLFMLCISHCHMDARICSAFELLKQHILLPCIIRSLESLATHRSSYNKATLDAITLHSVYLVYHSLTSRATPLSWDKDESLFEIEVIEEEELYDENSIPKPLAHSLTDFNDMLKVLYRAIKERAQECVSIDTHRWQLKEIENPVLVAKSTTVLFYIGADLASLVVEENNHRLHDRCILGRATTQICHYSATPLEPDAWQESFNARKETVDEITALHQEFQFVLFTPGEIKRNVDLDCLKGLLFEDLFNSVILRENGDSHFHRRLSEYFAAEQDSLDMGLFHRERCFATSNFEVIPKSALKETIFVPQAHMLSLLAMKNLLAWCITKHLTVKRVVFIGSLDLLPGHSHGQAFLDLLRAVSFQSINQAIYNYDRAADNFATLLDEQWRYLPMLERENNNTDVTHYYRQESLFQEQEDASLLYHIRSVTLFANLIASRQVVKDKGAIRFHTLYKQPFNTSQRSANPLHRALSTLFSGAKNAHIEITSLEIDTLTSYKAMTPGVAYFLISRKTLFSLDKNQVTLLFMMVDSLYVIDQVDGEFSSDKEDEKKRNTNLLDLLVAQFRASRRPNVRYSYTCLTK